MTMLPGGGNDVRFAYSTLNWGDTPDLNGMLTEINQAGQGAVEMFAQPLNWLGPNTRFQEQLDKADLKVAAFFGSVLVANWWTRPLWWGRYKLISLAVLVWTFTPKSRCLEMTFFMSCTRISITT